MASKFYFCCNWRITFAETDTKCDVQVVTLLTQDNTKILVQLKSGFKQKLLRKTSLHMKNIYYLIYLVNPSF